MASPPPSPPPPPSDDQHVAEKSDEELYEMFLELQHRSRVVVQEILQRRRPDDQQTRDPQHSRVSRTSRGQAYTNAGSSFEREGYDRNSTPAVWSTCPPKTKMFLSRDSTWSREIYNSDDDRDSSNVSTIEASNNSRRPTDVPPTHNPFTQGPGLQSTRRARIINGIVQPKPRGSSRPLREWANAYFRSPSRRLNEIPCWSCGGEHAQKDCPGFIRPRLARWVNHEAPHHDTCDASLQSSRECSFTDRRPESRETGSSKPKCPLCSGPHLEMDCPRNPMNYDPMLMSGETDSRITRCNICSGIHPTKNCPKRIINQPPIRCVKCFGRHHTVDCPSNSRDGPGGGHDNGEGAYPFPSSAWQSFARAHGSTLDLSKLKGAKRY